MNIDALLERWGYSVGIQCSAKAVVVIESIGEWQAYLLQAFVLATQHPVRMATIARQYITHHGTCTRNGKVTSMADLWRAHKDNSP